MTFAQAQKYFDTIADFTSDCSFVSSKKPTVISTLNFQPYHIITHQRAGQVQTNVLEPDAATGLKTRTALLRHHTRRGRAQGNQRPRSTVRPLSCRFGRRSIGGGLLRIRLRCSRTNNLRCRNLGRQNSILHAHSQTLLPLSCATACTKDTTPK